MRHDKLEGLIHFTQKELELLDEPRTPVDERAVKFIIAKAKDRGSSKADELTAEYITDPSVRSRNTLHIEGLRSESETLETIQRELITIDIEVDLKYPDAGVL